MVEGSDNIKTLNEYFDLLFPLALFFGMSPDEYWHGDPDLFFAYRSAFIYKIEFERQEYNWKAWLSGYYNLAGLYDINSKMYGKEGEEPFNYFSQALSLDSVRQEKPKDKIDEKLRLKLQEEEKMKLVVAQTMLQLEKYKKQQKTRKKVR